MAETERCASVKGFPCKEPIAEYCFKCDAGICAGHIFECRQCGNPMCHACWTELGQDLCPACKASD